MCIQVSVELESVWIDGEGRDGALFDAALSVTGHDNDRPFIGMYAHTSFLSISHVSKVYRLIPV